MMARLVIDGSFLDSMIFLMMIREANQIDVNGGFYTVAEAARLLGMEDHQRISRWLQPTAKGNDPVIVRDYPKIGREHEVSFLDMIEIRFVEHFRQRKISLQSLRVAAKNARRELGVSHPFATSSVKFQTDRKQVFLETAKETGDRFLLNLMTNQIEIYDVIESILIRHLEFDVDGFARQWRPDPAGSPNVVVAPIFAFGRPVISKRHIPTRTLFDSWLANDRNGSVVGDWFRIDKNDVDEAIRFELRPLH
jgi:uncharacterized protein (DUF433 family)